MSEVKFAYDHVGERVCITGGNLKGEEGFIRGRCLNKPFNNLYAVELVKPNEEAHPCDGLVKNGNGMWVHRNNFKFLPSEEYKKNIGKRIKVTLPYRNGEEGYVKGYDSILDSYAVEMDVYTSDTHDCGGLTKPNRGLWLSEGEFEVIEDPFEKKETPKTEEKEDKRGILLGDYVSFVHKNETTYGTVYTYEPESDVYGIRGTNGDTYWVCADRVVYVEPVKEAEKTVEEISKHYAEASIQPIEVMQANMTPEQFFGLLRGNLIKYLCRMGRKDDVKKETAKILEYAEWLHKAACGEKIIPRR